jgi:fructosamine-3-kinase
MNWQGIEETIERETQHSFRVMSVESISGGGINTAYRLQGENVAYFVKLNKPQLLPMFEAELAGLNEMSSCDLVHVPQGILSGTTTEHSFLVLEYIELSSGNRDSDRILGKQLAQMHLLQQPYFGWHRDNTIGCTPQQNDNSSNWIEFWRKRRLGYQLQLAKQNGYSMRLQKLGSQLMTELDSFFVSYQPEPALLHGDLWGGNIAENQQGQPVIFDPACYYGDREADLAMTELFGGFSADFYAAYNEVSPLDPGYAVRKNLYNLYHILNHLNLFGSGYALQAESMMQSLLAEVL